MDKLEKIKKTKRWKYKRYLFHVTDGMNVEKILSEGLIRGGGERKAFAVYMSKKALNISTSLDRNIGLPENYR